MRPKRHRERTFRVAAAGAVVVVGAAIGAPAAGADDKPTQPWAKIGAPDRIALPTAAENPAGIQPGVGYQFYDGGDIFPKPENVKLVIDASALKGVATIKAKSDQCSAEGAVVTCLDDGGLHGPEDPFTLITDADAKPGATGTLSYEVTADRATGDTYESKVVVGAPELVVGKLPDQTGLKPGSRVEMPIAVRNDGNLPAERVDLHLTGVPGLKVADKPSNCRFSDDWDGSPGVNCVVKTDIAPGATAELSAPLAFTLQKNAMVPWVDYTAEAVPADADEDENGTPGTGQPLAFGPASQGEFEKGGRSSVAFAAVNHADFAAKGGAIEPNKDGTSGELSFGLTNKGPGAAYRKDREPILYADITLPKGVTAESNYTDEEPDQDTTGACLTYLGPGKTKDFEPGHSRYLCPEASTEIPGEGQTYTLGVKYAKNAGKDATGKVVLVPGPAGFSTEDPAPANDTAKITFKGASGGSSGGSGTGGSGSGDNSGGSTSGGTGGSGSHGSGGSSSGGSDGGSMALTGAGGIGLMAGGAAVALALGTAAVVTTRRRRAVRS